MQVERWGYRITIRWPWLLVAGLIAVTSWWAWTKGWLMAAIIGLLIAVGMVAGPGVDIEPLGKLPPTHLEELEPHPLGERGHFPTEKGTP